MWTVIQQIAPYAIIFTIPLLITALGALFSERSGVVNIGLEGLMVIGAFTGALVILNMQEMMPGQQKAIWIGLALATLMGLLFSLLHAFASINLHANQIISGTAINMIAAAITVFLARNITGSGNIQISTLKPFNVPFLSDIPVIGSLLFTRTYATTWLVLAILLVSAFMLYKTPFGLRLRSCGEHPHAAEAAGISVSKMRYIGVMISGAFSGLGGAVFIVTTGGEFNGTVAGLGFLALASLIFGQWKPLGILAATLFFGFATTVANVSQVIPSLAVIPPVFLKVFPYVVTLIALIVFSKSSQAPKAVGEPFDSGKR
ncbi:ABC transporter permease [Sutcliffiella horikoshii]|uniref:ABC transporter permease n=1 Tax=Sutcliffiella horikoshii TaxID=79883 RepID=A0A1Y0CU48_9BACI|nr:MULTISPECIES: ABC transporter permease [Bacillaceae]ART78395.1 ABC transporter permease [Sutcliffiella horikoshii]NLP49714.1 ABC transporter permease [Bacillus sp. RO1]TYS59672.1 ABC transporter permease [Sutcliffiella horikoshii]TYS70197.1 ABC transporter permease [Sutcliffiella horikoshii]